MAQQRQYAGACSCNGRLYVAGSFSPTLGTMEILSEDSTPAQWIQGPPMHYARGGLTLSTVGTKLFAIGGYGGPVGAVSATGVPVRRSTVDALEVFDTETELWSLAASMPLPRDEHCSAVSGDRIYVFGGWRSGGQQEQLHDV